MSGSLFKRFSRETVTSLSQTKQSAQRHIRAKIIEQFPEAKNEIEQDVLPKKTPLMAVKCQGHITVIVVGGVPLFFQERDGPFCPTLRLLHKYPYMLPKMQVDIGGCKFLIGGANVMCPGLTSPGGRMDDVPAGAVVALHVEGKEHAVAIGITKMSTSEIASVNKDIGIFNLHYLGDGLWNTKVLE
eukprot:TRINITY_DN60713_c0_g2_i1.p1 TRINITY_DN60713_c0_g2~~TRINITY_DN60713_c0_g2_i1.p1  ORF type:complete len:186 (-),score=11.87 TRINITY_DN60713_c0_g2_i1:337-894(-)